jgi:hypothetical protein
MSGLLGSAQWMYASGAAVTQQSLKFNDDESQYLSWTPAAAGNRQDLDLEWLGSSVGILCDNTMILFSAGSSCFWSDFQVILSSSNKWKYTSSIYEHYFWFICGRLLLQTTQVFSDVSAWYHLLMTAFDTTQMELQATSCKIICKWFEQVTSFSTQQHTLHKTYDTAIIAIM